MHRTREQECQMGNVMRVLDADPDLGAALPPEVFAVAARHALAEVKEIPPGEWVPSSCYDGGHPLVGLLIIDGLLTRDMQFAGRMSSELMGAGDLLRAWGSSTGTSLPSSASGRCSWMRSPDARSSARARWRSSWRSAR